jgi:hypothetical protein
MFYVGGDKEKFNYNFKYASKDDATYPVKLYRGLINPSSPPPPGDTAYKLVTDQGTLDDLKNQNEHPITSVDTIGRSAVVNGQQLVLQSSSNPAIVDDFAHKTAGVTTGQTPSDHCPHSAYYNIWSNRLLNPNEFVPEIGDQWTDITKLYSQNGDSSVVSTDGNSIIPQILLKYDVVSATDDKYPIPVDRSGTASEVRARMAEWCKVNLGYLNITTLIKGLCPTGNKVYLTCWYPTFNDYENGGKVTNTSDAISTSNMNLGEMSIPNIIDDQGYCYFNIYTDPARTTDSTLLVLSGHGLVPNMEHVIKNITRNSVMVGVSSTIDTITYYSALEGQTAGDIIEKYAFVNQVVSLTGTSENTIAINGHGLSTGDYIRNISKGATISRVTVINENTFTTD